MLILLILLTPYLGLSMLILVYGKNREKPREQYEPTVTIFIPTFNEERYIGAKLDNLLAQTYSLQEILIYDCSEDNTPIIVKGYQ